MCALCIWQLFKIVSSSGCSWKNKVFMMIFVCVASVFSNPCKFPGLIYCFLLACKPIRMDVCDRKRKEREVWFIQTTLVAELNFQGETHHEVNENRREEFSEYKIRSNKWLTLHNIFSVSLKKNTLNTADNRMQKIFCILSWWETEHDLIWNTWIASLPHAPQSIPK